MLLIYVISYFIPTSEEFKVPEACIEKHNRKSYLTCKDINLKTNLLDIKVPRYFFTDLESTPIALRYLNYSNRSKFLTPAIVHDFLYRCPSELDRKEIDEIYYNSLLSNGVKFTTAFYMYAGVRLFGLRSFMRRNCYSGMYKFH